jgi:hypothetical protein
MNGWEPEQLRAAIHREDPRRGNAEGSTLRLTLGCLLADESPNQASPGGQRERLTFGVGEVLLSEWVAQNVEEGALGRAGGRGSRRPRSAR